MNVVKMVAVICVALLAGCATTPAKPVHNPMVAIRDYPATEGMAKFTQGCLQSGGSLESVGAQQAICAKPMDGSMRSIFIRALATPRHSTNPVYRARFSAIENGGLTTLHIEPYIEYQNAYGQTTKIPFTNAQELAAMQRSFDQEKAAWEAKNP